MSEALSTSEIEDVLSSIRRLVSDDLRPAPKAADPGDDTSKLLLTPALRVVQDNGASEEARPIDDVVASVGAGVDLQADEWEPETGDTSLGTPASDQPADFWEDAPIIEEYATNFEFVSARSSEGEAADGADDHDDVEAAGEAAATEEPVAEALIVEDAPVELPGWAQSAGADEADETRPEPAAAGTIEPDPVWADAAEAAVLQELQGGARVVEAVQSEPDLTAEAQDEDEGPEIPVNEAMLREIVRDVLREELQGRLGERITRNIRKLVRAEIARMMASDDLL